MKQYLREFLLFTVKEARACIFAGSFLVLLFLSHHLPLGSLPRYDFLFLAALGIQAVLIYTKTETIDEAKVILLFHLIGIGLELFKTHPAIGSWSYPEEGFFKIAGVPLYSGFMYAAVGSYISQSWRIMKLRLSHYPLYRYSISISVAIYINFFTHHFFPDLRWLLAFLVVIIFSRTTIYFTIDQKERSMPAVLSFMLIGFFIWIAENISTYFGAWKYPDQLVTWSPVSFHKISSWSLLVIISFIIVANLKHFKETREKA